MQNIKETTKELVEKILISLNEEKTFLEWQKSEFRQSHVLKFNSIELVFKIQAQVVTDPCEIQLQHLRVKSIEVPLAPYQQENLEEGICEYLKTLSYFANDEDSEKLLYAITDAIKSL